MRIAIVHDAIGEFGGAERFLQKVLDMYPTADVYTLFFDKKVIKHNFPNLQSKKVHSLLPDRPKFFFRQPVLQMSAPYLWRNISLDAYELIITSSIYLLSNVVITKKIFRVDYIHSIPKNLFGLEPQTRFQKLVPYTPALATIYGNALKRSRHILTNSVHMKTILSRLFHVNATVLYPPVNIPKRLPVYDCAQYYLIVSRLDPTKSLELGIRACSSLKLPLRIIGVSTDKAYENFLHQLAGPTVEFLDSKTDDEVFVQFRSAIALLFLSRNEDFGIVPVEAMAHGVPVIAFHGGGTRETVIEGVTGNFFYEHSVDALSKILKNFSTKSFDRIALYRHAKKFSEIRFKNEFRNYIHKSFMQ